MFKKQFYESVIHKMKLIRIILIFFGFVQKMEPGSFIVVPIKKIVHS